MNKLIFDYLVNLGLLLFTLLMMFSGLLLQAEYHMENHGVIEENKFVLGIIYAGWSDIHKVSSVLVLILLIFHVIRHLKWYKILFKKKLFAKNWQVVILSLFFVFVAVTGIIPWSIKLNNGAETTRKIFIEIHDKLALILAVYMILHIAKRLKWYLVSLKRLRQ